MNTNAMGHSVMRGLHQKLIHNIFEKKKHRKAINLWTIFLGHPVSSEIKYLLQFILDCSVLLPVTLAPYVAEISKEIGAFPYTAKAWTFNNCHQVSSFSMLSTISFLLPFLLVRLIIGWVISKDYIRNYTRFSQIQFWYIIKWMNTKNFSKLSLMSPR